MLLAPVRESSSHRGFAVLAALFLLVPSADKLLSCLSDHFYWARRPGANQCLPSPDRRLLSIQTCSAYVSVKYRSVISVLPRLGVFALANKLNKPLIFSL